MTAAPQLAPALGETMYGQAQQGVWEIVGAVKVKDGLFIGDEMAAQELEFVVTNKVTHVINCCGRQIPNHWEPIGVVYLTYYWLDNDSQVVLDARDVVVDEVTAFIDEALDNAESILIHSERGQGRSCVVLCAYLMRKYRWGMRKTLEFLQSRRPDVNLRPSYLQQLGAFERRLISSQKMKLSSDWSLSSVTPQLDSEEYLLRNTFMNSQMGPLADLSIRSDKDVKLYYGNLMNGVMRRSIDWSDAGEDDKARLEVPGNPPRVQKLSTTIEQPVKSCLKGSRAARREASDHSPDSAKGGLLNRPLRSASLSMDTLNTSVELGSGGGGVSRRNSLDGSLLRALSGADDDSSRRGAEGMQKDRGRGRDLGGNGSGGPSSKYWPCLLCCLGGLDIGLPSRLGSTRIPTRAWGDTSSTAAEESPPSRRPSTPILRETSENGESNKELWASGRGDGPSRRLPSPTMGSSNPLRSSSLSRREPSPAGRAPPPQQQHHHRYGHRDPSPGNQRFYSGSGSSYQRSDSPMMRSYQRSATSQQSQQERRGLLRGLPSSSGMGSLMGSAASSKGTATTTSSLRQNYMGTSSLRSSQGSMPTGAVTSSEGLGMLDPSKRGLPGSAVGRRPNTAPSLANGSNSSSMRSSPTGSYNRPPSPSVRSRPASPSMRPSQRPGSPSPQMMHQHNSSSNDNMKGGLVGGVGPPFDRVRHRSLTGHMRRAPSPTPAFNRNSQSGKPRWRM
ncbi:phosphatase, putative [Perkinsus marinus ATCC 50983]|uniref:Phosphatase, putative n=1 Tax=Perkinsus marinus (strain ATCC 50983 / TXsc) TaxID=423536 RepID=C5KTE9_PERM5|nr:phosphatase, putative [Perkinsus marinus ATCC 50983]EER12254.1 phosphatase, putative [Perkinsus marinus ATCC 50983]|eukprot:XP_002780459.1 phosphatase, putative [Perkinsus marinus ATCC 50983]